MSITSLLITVATLALLLLVGWIGGKLGYIDATATKKLSTLVVKIGQPFLIINALISQEYTAENLRIGVAVMILGLAIHGFMALVAYLLAHRIGEENARKISEFSMVFGNCGFIGFPIVEALYGQTGLFYGAFFLISFHLFVWTRGILILARNRKDIKVTAGSILFNFGTVPCLIGFLLFVIRLPLPAPLLQLSSYLAAICTPLSILVSGANIARRSLKAMFTNKRVYGTNLTKLVIQPILVATVLWLLGLPEYMIVFGAVMSAMPCAAIVTMFGEMYDITPGYGAELVGSSTVLCTFTIIPVTYFAQFLASHPLP